MENPQLAFTDLASIRSIIEAAIQRGAFKPNELTYVGAAYDKLAAFLTAHEPAETTSDTQTDIQPETQGEANA